MYFEGHRLPHSLFSFQWPLSLLLSEDVPIQSSECVSACTAWPNNSNKPVCLHSQCHQWCGFHTLPGFGRCVFWPLNMYWIHVVFMKFTCTIETTHLESQYSIKVDPKSVLWLLSASLVIFLAYSTWPVSKNGQDQSHCWCSANLMMSHMNQT